MATGDGFTSRLIAGAAQHLDDLGIGVYRASGAYTADEIGIYQRLIPPTPDRVITLATYVVPSPQGMADFTTGLQVRIRGTVDPRVCDDLGDAIFDAWDSAYGLRWSEIPIVQIYRQSAGSLGQDGNDRWEASHNYYVEAMRPTTYRTD